MVIIYKSASGSKLDQFVKESDIGKGSIIQV